MVRGVRFSIVLGLLGFCGCCGDTGREWTVTGKVIDADTSAGVVGAEVEVFFLFAIDGPGNRAAAPVITDAEGRFASHLDPSSTVAFRKSLQNRSLRHRAGALALQRRLFGGRPVTPACSCPACAPPAPTRRP